jgi:hypothetical protein
MKETVSDGFKDKRCLMKTCILRVSVHTALFLYLIGSQAGRADDWPRWRGPDGNAVSPETQLPLHWSTGDNVRWKVAIEGEGFSSPIIWGQRIFLTTAKQKGKRRLVLCLDLQPTTSNSLPEWLS